MLVLNRSPKRLRTIACVIALGLLTGCGQSTPTDESFTPEGAGERFSLDDFDQRLQLLVRLITGQPLSPEYAPPSVAEVYEGAPRARPATGHARVPDPASAPEKGSTLESLRTETAQFDDADPNVPAPRG
jgi:hypothetical protein